MSYVLQDLHIKFWWLKAQKCAHWNSVVYILTTPWKAREGNSSPFQWKQKQVLPEKMNTVHLQKMNLPGKLMNQVGWLCLPRRDIVCTNASGDFPGSTFCLSTLHYLLFILNSIPVLAALDHSCLSASLVNISQPPTPTHHLQPHPHLGQGQGSLLLNRVPLEVSLLCSSPGHSWLSINPFSTFSYLLFHP